MEIDDIIPRVRTYARAIPDPTARRAIVRAVQVLCQRTRIWAENDSITVTDPLGELVVWSQDAVVIGIIAARMAGIALAPVTQTEMDSISPGWAFDTALNAAPAQYIIAPSPNTIRLWPPSTGTLQARFFLEPADAAVTVPDLLRQHMELIALGAAHFAMMMPGTDFYLPADAEKHGARFQKGIDNLMWTTQRSLVRARPRTASRFF